MLKLNLTGVIVKQAAILTAIFALVTSSLTEDAEARPRLRYSGSSNSPFSYDFDIDVSVQDADPSPERGLFPGALKNVSVQFLGESKEFKLTDASDLIGYRTIAPVYGSETDGLFSLGKISQTLYQAEFPNVTVVSDFGLKFTFNRFTIYNRTNASENSLSVLEQDIYDGFVQSDIGNYAFLEVILDNANCDPKNNKDCGFVLSPRQPITVDIPDPEPPNPEPVPEPITGTILGAGALGGALMLKRRQAKKSAEPTSAAKTAEES